MTLIRKFSCILLQTEQLFKSSSKTFFKCKRDAHVNSHVTYLFSSENYANLDVVQIRLQITRMKICYVN